MANDNLSVAKPGLVMTRHSPSSFRAGEGAGAVRRGNQSQNQSDDPFASEVSETDITHLSLTRSLTRSLFHTHTHTRDLYQLTRSLAHSHADLCPSLHDCLYHSITVPGSLRALPRISNLLRRHA